jgi:hypothetical protein
MRFTKLFTGLALAAGMMVAGASTAAAQDFRYRRVEALRTNIASDRARLNEDMRRGHRFAADRDRAQLERDERALRFQMSHRDWR